jgi:hypothetical protein
MFLPLLGHHQASYKKKVLELRCLNMDLYFTLIIINIANTALENVR